MNPNIALIAKKVVESKISDRIEIITNGLLLTPKLTDDLVDAGVTHINISIQGVTNERYLETCGLKVDLDKLIENLTYLYNNKKQIQTYIKIVDATLKSKDEEALFYKIFGNICDRIYIEHLIVMQKDMDDLKDVVDGTKNFYGEELKPREVCSQSFYFLQIGCDGHTFPCPNPGLPKSLSMGNIFEKNMVDIWNDRVRKSILRKMLEFKRNEIEACADCTTFTCINDPLENLDVDAEKVVHLFRD